ncbi:uncharacterized protein N7503_011455 [Penicillium pulvis]|uniref:uncharacterized protein n=1 Tax=Penicillium pulvis TaxID=1562058 RepID=UPI002548D450|nr:uncharacterized protein N7503_011455 [Penicillium pulvis]KAJ5786243.1 hypothetical protein N7503_011455 [Penicillium pulvis]
MEDAPPIEEMAVSIGDGAINQVFGLPEKIEIDVFSGMDRLEEPEDFDLWLRNTTRLLKSAGLDKLVDIHIPRPEVQNEGSKRWLLYSKLVQHYLSESIADGLLANIASRGKSIKLADEFVDEAKRAFQNPGIYADLDGIASICSIQLSNHKTAQEFVWEFREHCKRLWDLQISIPPYVAICKLINQLDTMETKFVVASTIADLHRRAETMNLWTGFEQVDFHVVSFNIIQRLEAEMQDHDRPRFRMPLLESVGNKLDFESVDKELQNFKASLDQHAVKVPDVDQSVRDLKRFTNADRKHFPKAGVNRAAYAQQLRDTLGELESKDCAYCGQKFHTAAKCFYLNPSSRPKHWRPDPRIWVFMYGVVGEEEPIPAKKLVVSPTENNKVVTPPEKKPRESLTGNKKVQTPTVKKLEESSPQNIKMEPIAVKKLEASPPGNNKVEPITVNRLEESPPGNKQVTVKMPAENQSALKPKGVITKEATGENSSVESLTKCDTDSPFVGSAFDTSNSFTASKCDWLVLKGPGHHICADLTAMTEYYEYGPEDIPFEWTWNARGKRSEAHAVGKGKAKISLLCEDRATIMKLFVDCYYCPDSRFSLLFIEKAEKDLLLEYNDETKALHDKENDMKIVGYTVNEHGLSFLGTLDSTIKEVNLMDMD